MAGGAVSPGPDADDAQAAFPAVERARLAGATRIAGVDEVGRGALFGPVVAAAVILPEEFRLRGLRDSKQLEACDRERMDAVIRRKALAWAVAEIDAEMIDRVNIYHDCGGFGGGEGAS
jgi:ribonuclease HII